MLGVEPWTKHVKIPNKRGRMMSMTNFAMRQLIEWMEEAERTGKKLTPEQVKKYTWTLFKFQTFQEKIRIRRQPKKRDQKQERKDKFHLGRMETYIDNLRSDNGVHPETT